jgi:hypothetical protein
MEALHKKFREKMQKAKTPEDKRKVYEEMRKARAKLFGDRSKPDRPREEHRGGSMADRLRERRERELKGDDKHRGRGHHRGRGPHHERDRDRDDDRERDRRPDFERFERFFDMPPEEREELMREAGERIREFMEGMRDRREQQQRGPQRGRSSYGRPSMSRFGRSHGSSDARRRMQEAGERIRKFIEGMRERREQQHRGHHGSRYGFSFGRSSHGRSPFSRYGRSHGSSDPRRRMSEVGERIRQFLGDAIRRRMSQHRGSSYGRYGFSRGPMMGRGGFGGGPMMGRGGHGRGPMMGRGGHGRGPMMGRGGHGRGPMMGRGGHGRGPMMGRGGFGRSPMMGRGGFGRSPMMGRSRYGGCGRDDDRKRGHHGGHGRGHHGRGRGHR